MISCHKKYSNKSDLSQHKKVHNESKCFKCEICLKVFNEKQNLKRHYRTHTGEKPFDCQICGRKFACKSNLVRHQATHSKIKSFKCTICSESRFFKTKNELSQHMLFHYEPKFSCSFCDLKTYRSGDLKRHEKTHFKIKK